MDEVKLDPEFRHFLALDRLSMSYSWYNIRSDYNNNTIKYSHNGSTWHTITFTDGMYSYSDMITSISTWIKSLISQQAPKEKRFIQSIWLLFWVRIECSYRLMVIINLICVEQILEISSDLKRNWWLKQSMEHASLILQNRLTH